MGPAEFYDAHAEEYDRAYSSREAKAEDSVVRSWLSPAMAAGWVLDAGCGTGWVLDQFPDKAPQLVGVDISTEMLAVAAQKHPEAQWFRASMDNLPDTWETRFQTVTALYSLSYNTDPMRTARELRRVTAPGGRIFVLAYGCRGPAYQELGWSPSPQPYRLPARGLESILASGGWRDIRVGGLHGPVSAWAARGMPWALGPAMRLETAVLGRRRPDSFHYLTAQARA